MTPPNAHPRDRLIVALDKPTVSDARALVDAIGAEATFYKIGLELILSPDTADSGLRLVGDLVDEGKQVFLDAKLLDIPNTVERSVSNVARLGASLLTVHGHDTRTLQAAVAGRGNSGLRLLAVTVLTSIDAADLTEQGVDPTLTNTPEKLVARRATMAHAAGFDGVVASGREAAAIRAQLGNDALIVTPGIRLPGAEAGDQQRVATPEQAISDGASHIVVGRPINAAADPRAAAAEFVRRIASAIDA